MIHREDRGDVAVLRMEHGKANAIDIELFEQLVGTLDEVRDSGAAAVVLTGSGTIFSAGVELFRVLDGGARYLETFLPALTRGLEALFSFPRPVVAAINGHAVAGGAIVACACDHRVMARGKGRVGVPELKVGVPYPTLALEILRSAMAPQHVQEVVYGGATYPPEEALARGLVDELVEAEELEERAVAVAAAYGSIPAPAFRLTKRQLRRPVLERFEAYAPVYDRQVAEIWASPESAAAIRAYLERTLKKG